MNVVTTSAMRIIMITLLLAAYTTAAAQQDSLSTWTHSIGGEGSITLSGSLGEDNAGLSEQNSRFEVMPYVLLPTSPQQSIIVSGELGLLRRVRRRTQVTGNTSSLFRQFTIGIAFGARRSLWQYRGWSAYAEMSAGPSLALVRSEQEGGFDPQNNRRLRLIGRANAGLLVGYRLKPNIRLIGRVLTARAQYQSTEFLDSDDEQSAFTLRARGQFSFGVEWVGGTR